MASYSVSFRVLLNPQEHLKIISLGRKVLWGCFIELWQDGHGIVVTFFLLMIWISFGQWGGMVDFMDGKNCDTDWLGYCLGY